MADKQIIKRKINSYQTLKDMSEIVHTSAQMNYYSICSKIKKIQNQIDRINDLNCYIEFKKSKKITILVQFENSLFLSNLECKKNFDYIIGSSAIGQEKYLMSCKEIEELHKKLQNYHLSFIILGQKGEYIKISYDDIYRYDKQLPYGMDYINEIDSKSMLIYLNKVLLQIAIYSNLQVEYLMTINIMQSAIDNTGKTLKKNKVLYSNLVKQQLTNELIITSLNWSKKSDS